MERNGSPPSWRSGREKRLKADGFVEAGPAGPPSGGLGIAMQAVGSPGAVQSRSDTPSGLFQEDLTLLPLTGRGVIR